MRYIVFLDDKELGPFDEAEIRKLFSDGGLTVDSIVRPEKDSAFCLLAELEIFQPKTSLASIVPPPKYNLPFY